MSKRGIPLTKTRTPIQHLEALLKGFDEMAKRNELTRAEKSQHTALYWLLQELKGRGWK